MFYDFVIYQKISNVNVVQSCWNFVQWKEVSKEPKLEVSNSKNKDLVQPSYFSGGLENSPLTKFEILDQVIDNQINVSKILILMISFQKGNIRWKTCS